MDDKGDFVLPVGCWRELLQELDLPEDGDAAFFLMDFVEPYSKGLFTYTPLMEALRGPGLEPERQPAQVSRGNGTAGGGPMPPDRDGDDDPQTASGYPDTAEMGRGSTHFPFPTSPSGLSPTEDRAADLRNVSAGRPPSMQPSPRAATPTKEAFPMAQGGYGGYAQVEVVDEAFWQRCGPSIQRLFFQWDCNQLTNPAFQGHMQRLLGTGVDVSHPESEFLRLINKHLSARTMKFASLMSALRRDAHNTVARQTGGSCLYAASSYAGSAYEPSEAGTEASAAGRPSLGVEKTSRGGRRHFNVPTENAVLPKGPPRANLGRLPEDSTLQEEGRGSPGAGSATSPVQEVDIFGRKIAHPLQRAHPRPDADAVSVTSAAQSISSEADQQREVFSYRNRNGHGNILAWDVESRTVTPPHQRQGRHMATDPEKGIPRLHVSSGIFS
ncbi:unnamed protein product [Symbiodinium natans]|uniref:Uncharacterized protein n=1 Tax=Symbiodinium natans TaxID=878477 RepID=A0A812KMR6_9DINO|nr:unnamed protein product [Symbiodinium natans]